MDNLTGRIMRHMSAEPENFDGREELWMKREAQRHKLKELERRTTTWAKSFDNYLNGRHLTLGAGLAALNLPLLSELLPK